MWRRIVWPMLDHPNGGCNHSMTSTLLGEADDNWPYQKPKRFEHAY